MPWEGASHWGSMGPSVPLCPGTHQGLSPTHSLQRSLFPHTGHLVLQSRCSLAKPQAAGQVGLGLAPNFARWVGTCSSRCGHRVHPASLSLPWQSCCCSRALNPLPSLSARQREPRDSEVPLGPCWRDCPSRAWACTTPGGGHPGAEVDAGYRSYTLRA